MSWEPEVKELQLRRQKSLQLGGEERVARHHQAGKLTVRERIDASLDLDSFQEIAQLCGDATWEDAKFKDIVPAPYVMGLGKIDGGWVALDRIPYKLQKNINPHLNVEFHNLADSIKLSIIMLTLLLLPSLNTSII